MSSYRIIDGVLHVYYGKAAHAVIPDRVTKIDEYAFGRCNSLRSITIPNNVTKIGEMAFCLCDNLTNITMPNSVSYIGFSAFSGIKKVKPQYNSNGSLRAFKAFNQDWKCRGFQYKVGESYHQDGVIACCDNGFHACTNPLSLFNHYYGCLADLHFAEVELSGDLDWGYSNCKVAASDIRIIRELSVQELCEIYNNMEKV